MFPFIFSFLYLFLALICHFRLPFCLLSCTVLVLASFLLLVSLLVPLDPALYAFRGVSFVPYLLDACRDIHIHILVSVLFWPPSGLMASAPSKKQVGSKISSLCVCVSHPPPPVRVWYVPVHLIPVRYVPIRYIPAFLRPRTFHHWSARTMLMGKVRLG